MIILISIIFILFLFILYYILVYREKINFLNIFENVHSNENSTTTNLTFDISDSGKFKNIKIDQDDEGNDIIVTEETDIPVNFITGMPWSKSNHGGITLIENGFRVAGIDTNFVCPPPFYFDVEKNDCVVRDICEGETEPVYKGIDYYQFREMQLQRDGSSSNNIYHERIYMLCPERTVMTCPSNKLYVGGERSDITEEVCNYYDICKDNIDGFRHVAKIAEFEDLEENQYYQCLDGNSILITCAENLVFNIDNLACQSVRCTENSRYVNDDSSYFQCQNGRLVTIKCPNGTTSEGLNCLTDVCVNNYPIFNFDNYFTNVITSMQLCENNIISTVFSQRINVTDPYILGTNQKNSNIIFDAEKDLLNENIFPITGFNSEGVEVSVNIEEMTSLNPIIFSVLSTYEVPLRLLTGNGENTWFPYSNLDDNTTDSGEVHYYIFKGFIWNNSGQLLYTSRNCLLNFLPSEMPTTLDVTDKIVVTGSFDGYIYKYYVIEEIPNNDDDDQEENDNEDSDQEEGDNNDDDQEEGGNEEGGNEDDDQEEGGNDQEEVYDDKEVDDSEEQQEDSGWIAWDYEIIAENDDSVEIASKNDANENILIKLPIQFYNKPTLKIIETEEKKENVKLTSFTCIGFIIFREPVLTLASIINFESVESLVNDSNVFVNGRELNTEEKSVFYSYLNYN